MDQRARAFRALLGVAAPINKALSNVNEAVIADRDRNAESRSGWTSIQRMSASGYGRFCWAVEELRSALAVAQVRFISTPEQERSNVFLWQIAPRVTLRVKRDPEELREELTQPLFTEASEEADQTACLTWHTNPDLSLDNARFVSVHGEHWSIPLIELLAATRPSNVVSGTAGGPAVRSKRQAERDEGTAQQ